MPPPPPLQKVTPVIGQSTPPPLTAAVPAARRPMNVRPQLVCGPIGGRISDKIELQSNSYSQPGRTYLILPSKLYSLYNCAGIPKQRGHSSSPSHALYTAPTSSVINGILYYFMLPYESRQICLVRFISTLNYFTTICILPRPPTECIVSGCLCLQLCNRAALRH